MDFKLDRPEKLCNKAVIVDGLPGCGKTMLSAVISSIDRVELFQYANDIETYCILNYFKKIETQIASKMISSKMDYMLYNLMMSREVNFRYSDLSSVFKSHNKIKYFRRLFAKGDQAVPELIDKEKPILHLVTHCISAFSNPLINCLNENMLLINFHRNPLYMIKQNMWNMENLIDSNRDFSLYYNIKKEKFPYYFYGQEEKMMTASSKEKAIFFLEWIRKIDNQREINSASNYYELTFESFVKEPDKHLKEICKRLGTKITNQTLKALKREKIPRKILSHGRDLSIYRRVSWEKTNAKSNSEEIDKLYKWVTKGISAEAKNALNWLMNDYEKFTKKELK